MNIFQKLFGKKEKPAEVEKPDMRIAEAEKEAPASKPEPAKAEPVKQDGDAKKLKRRIAELEDDLDDAKDEAKKAQKRLEEAKKEKTALQEELDRVKTEHEKIKGEHETVKSNLETAAKDLGLKKKSIDFVNEILNAIEASDQRTLEIYEKTGAIMNFVQDSICGMFKEIYENGKEIAEIINFEIWKWANLQRKTWLKDKVVVAFIGEFSAGKTSIVNRIFTQDRKDAAFTLPTDRGATTAVATYISYGDNPKAQFTDPTGELRELSKDVFLQFTKDSLENISVSRLVSHFVTEYNNENLKRLSILDTPGFSSGDREDEERTKAVIDEADMLFWVVDANMGEINTTSVEIVGNIKEHVRDIPLYVVINKVDTKAPAERAKIEQKMRETMEKAGIPVQGFIQFSIKEPLEVLNRIINTVQPRRPDYDVIADINDRFDDYLNWCKKQIDAAQKEAQDYNRAINEAESIIDAYDGKFERLKNKYSNLEDSFFDAENLTPWGNIEKKKMIPILEDQRNVVNKIINLDDDMFRAVVSYQQNSHKKEELDSHIAVLKDKQKRLKELRTKFNKKLLELQT